LYPLLAVYPWCEREKFKYSGKMLIWVARN
jgi:hypothetical protein